MGLFDVQEQNNGAVAQNAVDFAAAQVNSAAAVGKELTHSQKGTQAKNTLCKYVFDHQAELPADVVEAAKFWSPTTFGIAKVGTGGFAPTYFTPEQRKVITLFGGDIGNETPEVFDGLVGRSISEDEVFAKIKAGRGEMRGIINSVAKKPKNTGKVVTIVFDATSGTYTLTAVTPFVAA